jgi:co-chaperonin GroES (HSP10)|tara:strand:- start:462 stop:722 length:261 start_codon:yes stop_codon:yes gene_type:complete
MKALGNWVVLKRKDEEVTDKLGLVVSDITDKGVRHKLAEVISVGKEVEDLVVGDQVYYDFAAGSQLRVSGNDIYTVISEKHIVIKV